MQADVTHNRNTVRVALRPAATADATALRAWRAEESVRRFQPLRDATLAELRADLLRSDPRDLYRGRGDRFVWIILADREPCGWITLIVVNWEHGLGEIGYALSTPFQRKGLMEQALSLLLPELFLRTSLERIEARCAIGNVASQRVLTKLGFVNEGTLRAYFRIGQERIDHRLFALLRTDYLPL